MNYKRPIRLACVGDSLTEGRVPSGNNVKSYPAFLQEMLGWDYQVENFGVAGASVTIDKMPIPYIHQERFYSSLGFEPDAFILMLGTNDWETSEEIFIKDATYLIQQYQNLPSSPLIFLATTPTVYGENPYSIDPEKINTAVAAWQRQLAADNNCILLDMNTAIQGFGSEFSIDCVHANDAVGYALYAQLIYTALKASPFYTVKPPKHTLMANHVDVPVRDMFIEAPRACIDTYFTFDLTQSIWTSQQGKPGTECGLVSWRRVADMRILPEEYNTQIAYQRNIPLS